MTKINNINYIERRTGKKTKRDWWFVTYPKSRYCQNIYLGILNVPKRFFGKKIRFKVEVYEPNTGVHENDNNEKENVTYDKKS